MASDARDILGDAAVSSLPKPTEKKSKSKRHRPAGMSYELFGLLNAGPSDPHPLGKIYYNYNRRLFIIYSFLFY